MIFLQRDLSSYIVDIYIPSSFVVSLSFTSFFIDYKSAPARAPLGVTSVLTITTMTGGNHQKKNTERFLSVQHKHRAKQMPSFIIL